MQFVTIIASDCMCCLLSMISRLGGEVWRSLLRCFHISTLFFVDRFYASVWNFGSFNLAQFVWKLLVFRRHNAFDCCTPTTSCGTVLGWWRMNIGGWLELQAVICYFSAERCNLSLDVVHICCDRLTIEYLNQQTVHPTIYNHVILQCAS